MRTFDASCLPVSEHQGWTTLFGSADDDAIQVRKIADRLYLLRQGREGTAIAVTRTQIEAMMLHRPD